MNKLSLNDILIYDKLGFEICRLLPEPFDKYAYNLKNWVKCAHREDPPGKCVITCSAIKSMVTHESKYIEAALEIVRTESESARASVLGLAGLVLCHIGQEYKGIQLLRDAFKLEPCNRYFLSLASELAEIENFDESCGICQEVLQNDPDNLEAKRVLAVNYLNMGEREKALKVISEVLVENPKDKKARRISGTIFFDKGHFKSAILEYKKATGFFDYDPYIIYHLARCYFALGRVNKSRRYVKKINPKAFKIAPYFRDNENEIKEIVSEILGER